MIASLLFHRLRQVVMIAALLTLAACELQQVPALTPTVEQTETPSPSLTVTPVMTETVEPGSSEAPPVAVIPTETLIPPTATDIPTPTETPNPFATWIIQPNDTLLYIIQQPPFFYRNAGVIDVIVALNDSIRRADQLPPPGSSILIPLPSFTPTPEGAELTAVANAGRPNISLPSNSEILQVEVQEGETILGFAGRNATSLVILATLNPQLRFTGCDFANPSGGPDCNVLLRVGDSVNVPAPTPTPTLSPTFSGSETPTATPTYAPPVLIFPPRDSVAPPRSFTLQWVTVGELRPGEVYLVEIEDQTSGARYLDVTRATSYLLPEVLIPADGQTHTIRWRVTLAQPNAQGAYRFISPVADWRTFLWASR